jgi:Tfp pilus assembly PilM family ATPase
MEMRGGGPEPQILRAGSVPLPAGAMDGDRIVQVEAVAELIRGLHSRLQCSTKDAVIGMGLQNVVTRILAVPRVPDSELRAVIEGELAHFQILRAGMGAFDFFRLDNSAASTDASPSVLLMAVEDRIAQGYRLTAEKAGLRVQALEPITLSLFRAGFPRVQAEPAAMCLSITPQRSELSILDHAQIRLYRRLDIGSNDFIAGRRGGSDASSPGLGEAEDSGSRPARTLLGDSEDTANLAPTAGMGGVPLGGGGTLSDYGEIIPQAAASLANEVQKTLDYYRREYPNATPIARIVLATNDPDAEGLSEWLSHALRIEVTVANNPVTPGLPPQTAQQLEPPNGLRFLGAAGLALHQLTPDWTQVPRFNLASGVQAKAAVGSDRLTIVVVVSLCILLGGVLGGVIYNTKTSKNLADIDRNNVVIVDTGRKITDVLSQLRDESALRGIVRADNLPVPRLMDAITEALPPNVGLTNVQIDRKGKVTVDGKAKNYELYFIYSSQLEKCAGITPPKPTLVETDEKSDIVTFRLECSVKGTHADKEASASEASGT